MAVPEHDLIVTWRPSAKRPWRIKRGHEVIRLTPAQMRQLIGCHQVEMDYSYRQTWTFYAKGGGRIEGSLEE